MSTRFGGFRPGLLPALVKVAIIGTWNGRTFLHDNDDLADIADYVPDGPESHAVAAGSDPLAALDEQGRAEQALIAQLKSEQALVASADRTARRRGSAA